MLLTKFSKLFYGGIKMAEKKGLSHTAYGGIKGEDYIPYVSTKEALPELTGVSIVVGCIFAIIFGAANTYLGLKVGMTIAAGIPAAILATAVFKNASKNKILEANMIQSMAAMGESLAGGLIFTIPAILLLKMDLTIFTIVIVALLGGLLGILFVVPLRKYLIVEEHGKLIYPEAMATSEVLVTGTEGGKGLRVMMTGVVIGGLFKLFSGGFKFWSEEPEWAIKGLNTNFGVSAYASLVGVGFIVGLEIATYMFAGAVVAWFGLIPLIKFFGDHIADPIFPSTVKIAEMGAGQIWSKYVRYIGAGAVAAGGFISIVKAMPTIVRSFKSAMSGISAKGGQKRTDVDVPMTWVVAGALFVFVIAWLFPMLKGSVVSGILILICAFFFAVVSARLVGLIGTSNNPISGMTIATLLVVTGILKATGKTGNEGMFAAIVAGGIVCVAIAIAGGSAQSLKATYVMGGTPKKLEIGMYIAVALSSVVIGYLIIMLNQAYTLGGEQFGAPQATLMSMVVQGIMDNQIPWALVVVGVGFGVMCELMKIPVLPFALGLYLPIGLSSGVLAGGIIRWLVEKKFKKDENTLKVQVEKGVLLSSGLIAGEAIIGILLAGLAIIEKDTLIAFGTKIVTNERVSAWIAAVMLIILCIWVYNSSIKGGKAQTNNTKPNMKA
jgi:putative OPT family oligopeptide transporter